MAQLKPMTGDEFVRKILAGEKDFSLIDLLDFDLSSHEGFEELQRYLKAQKLIENPLIISYSRFNRLKAKRLYAPYTRCVEACLKRADFEGADLEGAYFLRAHLEKAHFGGADLRWAYLEGAHLQGAHLEKAHLQGAHLEKAHLQGAHLQGAHLKRAHLKRADLERADLKGALHLKDALGLGTTHFLRTRVSKEQRAIIGKALKKTPRLIVE